MAVDNDWTAKSGKELGEAVVRVGRSLWDSDAFRREAMLRLISRYEGRKIESLESWSPTSYERVKSDGIEQEPIRWNLCQQLVDTVQAKVAGSQQPKVTFVCSNADWSTRRKGPKQEQFIHGLWSSPQEPYTDIWDLGCSVFRDAAVCGIGHIKSVSDEDAGKVIHERVFPWELLVAPQDAKYGRPSHLFQVTTYPRATLIAWFPEAKEALEQYRGDAGIDDNLGPNTFAAPSESERVVDLVRCYEWWLLPLSTSMKGKHVLAFQGGILIEEDWERDTFPFASIRWAREFQGWHGRSLIDTVAAIDDEMNDLVARVVRTVRLTGMARTYRHVEDTSDEEDNADAVTVRFSGMVPPVTQSPAPISPVHVQLIEILKSSGYEFSGVNQMTATAQKQPGIDSGAAIRLVANIQSERFAVVWRAYQQMFVEIARNDIACVRQLAKKNKDFSAKWNGNKFLREIPWSKVDLADDMYVIQIASAPSVKGSPADRLQTAQELFAMGKMSADSLMSVQRYYDLPAEMQRQTTHADIIDQYIERWLDATPEQIQANTADDGQPLFTPPISLMNLEPAILQVLDGYLQAELDGAPDYVKELFLRWIEYADSELQKRAAKKAALAPQAPAPMGPSPLPPPQGMPPA